MNRTKIIVYISLILFGIFLMPIFSYAADMYVNPYQQNIQKCLSADLYISLNTSWDKVIASDIKFFLQWLSLSNFTALPWFNHVTYIGTWISTKWPNIGSTYYYIDAHQNSFSNPVIGNNIAVAKIKVTPIPGELTWSIQFYDLSGNDEDSNISVWIDYWTEGFPIRYSDALSHTISGNYNFIDCVVYTRWVVVDDCELPSNIACANEEWEDYSDSYYDHTCCAPEEGHGAAPSCDISNSPYDDQELNDAFQRAYSLNITNKCPITEARLETPIIRMEVAKMMTMFTIQVIGIYPDTHKVGCDLYPDIQHLNSEMQFFTKTSCQLDLMELKSDGKTPDEIFEPYNYVDRAQFGTVLSRLIYGDEYNIYEGEETIYKRYEKHLRALHEDDIIHKIENPSMLEQRWWVILMLYRIMQQDLVAKYRLVAPAHNGAIVLLENVR